MRKTGSTSTESMYTPKSFYEISSRTAKLAKTILAEIFIADIKLLPKALFHAVFLGNIIGGFWILDSLKDPIVAGTIGIKNQPTAKLISVVFTLVIVCVYDKLNSLVSKFSLFHITSVLYGTSFLIISAVLSHPNHGINAPSIRNDNYIGWVAYCLIESYGSLSVALFWSFTNSVMDFDQAKGLYGIIIATAQIGAILGSTLATNVSYIGLPQLCLVATISVYSITLFIKLYDLNFNNSPVSLRDMVSRRRFHQDEPIITDNDDDIYEHMTGNISTMDVDDVISTRISPILIDASVEPLSLETSEPKLLPKQYTSEELVIRSPNQIPLSSSPVTASNQSYYPSPVLSRHSSHQPQYNPRKSKPAFNISEFFRDFYTGLLLIIRYRYVLTLFGISCLYEIVLTILDYKFKLQGNQLILGEVITTINTLQTTLFSSATAASIYSHNTSDPSYLTTHNTNIPIYNNYDSDNNIHMSDGLIKQQFNEKFTDLMGRFGQLTNSISLLVSLVGFSYLTRSLGVRYTLLINPLLLLTAVILIHLIRNMWLTFIFVSLLKGLSYSLFDPVKELLYIPTSNDIKYRAKAWIDVFGARLAKAIGSSITYFSYGSLEKLRLLSEIPSICICVLYLYLAVSIGSHFEYLIENKQVIGRSRSPITIVPSNGDQEFLVEEDEADIEVINGLGPGDVGYQGYDLKFFDGVNFDSIIDDNEEANS